MVQKIVDLHRQGFPLSYIAAWTGLPEHDVRQQLAKSGVPAARSSSAPRPSLHGLFHVARGRSSRG